MDTKSRTYVKMFISDFSEATIDALVRAAGETAPLFTDTCKRCRNEFTVMAYTAVSQFRRAKSQGRETKFKPPVVCKNCFMVTQGKSVPIPPRNAVLRKPSDVDTIPERMVGTTFHVFKKRWERREVQVLFKEKVSFSSADESGVPDQGFVLGVTRDTITLLPKGEPVHNARTFALSDIAKIQTLKMAKHDAAVAVATALVAVVNN